MRRSVEVAVLMVLSAGAFAQSNCPLTQDEVLKLACGRQTMKEKIDAVGQRGVNFEIDLAFAKRVNQQCGQQVELIRTIEKSYKQGCTEIKPPDPPKPAEDSLPDGPPLSRHQVVLLLDAKVDQAKIIRLIEKRKVNFEVAGDAAVTKELREAGADAKLLGALVINGAK